MTIQNILLPNATIAMDDTPMTKSSSGSSINFAREDHNHQSPGGIVSITSTKTVTNSIVETQLVGVTIPANFLNVGTTFIVRASGAISTASTAPVSTWRIRIGSYTLTGYIITSTVPVVDKSLTQKPWSIQVIITTTGTGTAGSFMGSGTIQGEYSTTLAQAVKGLLPSPVVTPINTTVPLMLELTFQLGTANAANTLVCYNAVIEVVKM